MKQPKTPLQVVPANSALRLRSLLDFTGDDKKDYVAGDEWLFEGPGTYIPRKEVEVVEMIKAVIIKPNQAIKLRARKETMVQKCIFLCVNIFFCIGSLFAHNIL